jgi:hypothetical protein
MNLQLFGETNFDKLILNKQPACTVANAVASVAAPTKAEFDAVVALVNDLKAKYNAIAKG